jgi:hypothetical protein
MIVVNFGVGLGEAVAFGNAAGVFEFLGSGDGATLVVLDTEGLGSIFSTTDVEAFVLFGVELISSASLFLLTTAEFALSETLGVGDSVGAGVDFNFSISALRLVIWLSVATARLVTLKISA